MTTYSPQWKEKIIQPVYNSQDIEYFQGMYPQQIKELQKRNAMLEEENLILKKAIAIFTPHSNRD